MRRGFHESWTRISVFSICSRRIRNPCGSKNFDAAFFALKTSFTEFGDRASIRAFQPTESLRVLLTWLNIECDYVCRADCGLLEETSLDDPLSPSPEVICSGRRYMDRILLNFITESARISRPRGAYFVVVRRPLNTIVTLRDRIVVSYFVLLRCYFSRIYPREEHARSCE